MHVAAVSSGDMHPYPLVNNTERWQALRDSCPYPFTILGQNEVWAGDRSVTNNKLFFYMKCVRPSRRLLLRKLAPTQSHGSRHTCCISQSSYPTQVHQSRTIGCRWLQTLPAEDIVIIVDAHDVLFFPCQRDIVAEYHAAGWCEGNLQLYAGAADWFAMAWGIRIDATHGVSPSHCRC